MALADALQNALDSLPLSTSDQATVELARTYAAAIDDGDDLHRIGPLLLATLVELRMTPKARAAVAKGGSSEQPSTLDELRERRRRRAAQAVDAAAAGTDT